MPSFWETVVLLVIIGWCGTKCYELIQIHKSARKLGLRDRGTIRERQTVEGQVIRVHGNCNTKIRIGIKKNGESVHFCWRCECILNDNSGGPNGRKSFPVTENKPKLKLVNSR